MLRGKIRARFGLFKKEKKKGSSPCTPSLKKEKERKQIKEKTNKKTKERKNIWLRFKFSQQTNTK
jgi:hypothetical protein